MTENQRKLKQLFILGLVLSVVITITWMIFKPKEPTCFNGIRDADEENTDCGGACEKLCPPSKPPQVQDVTIAWAKALKKGEDRYTLLGRFTNNNELWGISLVNYSFKVYDENGELIDVRSGQTYAMPKGFMKSEGDEYIVEDNFKTEKKISRVELDLGDYKWSGVLDMKEIPELNKAIIAISDKRYGRDESGVDFYYASGVTKNLSRYSFYKVDIIVVLFDKNEEPIAAGKTDQWTVGADNGWGFKVFWREPFEGEVERVEYSAETNVFDIGNFMQYYGTGEYFEIPR